MTDQTILLERQMEAQQHLREGLSGIEQAQASLFEHLERMAAHIVALEAIVTVSAPQQAVSVEAVVQTIKERIQARGADESAARSAIDVAHVLLGADRAPSDQER